MEFQHGNGADVSNMAQNCTALTVVKASGKELLLLARFCVVRRGTYDFATFRNSLLVSGLYVFSFEPSDQF